MTFQKVCSSLQDMQGVLAEDGPCQCKPAWVTPDLHPGHTSAERGSAGR